MRLSVSRVLIASALAAAIGAIGVLGGNDSGRATSFNPMGSVEVEDTTAGANSDIVINLNIDEPDSIFSSVISFIPPEWGFAGCMDPMTASTACADDMITDGAMIGTVDSDSVLSLANSACTNALDLPFELMDATTDQSATVVFHDTDEDGIGEQFEDDDGDGLPNGVEMYPDYLLRLIRNPAFNPGDPGASEPLQPIARMYSQLRVASDVPNVSVQFVVLEPGTMINGTPLDPRLGYPVVLVLNDLGDPGMTAQPGDPVTGLCSPLASVATTFGVTQDNPETDADESGEVYLTNPGEGTYNMVLFLASEYDADGDGIENPLDTCPVHGNTPGWDPRDATFVGDNDQDGIPNICDPAPDQNVNAGDHDGDQFLNHADTCPLTVNADQLDFDRDDLGNACDPDPGATTGHAHVVCLVQEVTIGAAPAGNGEPPPDPQDMFPCALDAPIIFGDIDCVAFAPAPPDIGDVLAYLKFQAGVDLDPAPLCTDAGDLNCDGVRNEADVLVLLQAVAGLEPEQGPMCPPIGTVIG